LKSKLLLITLWIITICWIGIIFFLSSQNGEQTANTSVGIAKKTAEVIYTQPTIQQINSIHFDLRRISHIGLFFILGGLVHAAVKSTFNYFNRKSILLPWIIAVAISSFYGFFDEWHKQFIPGRHFDTGETLLNVISSIAGVAIAFGIMAIYKRKNTGAK